MKTLKTTILVTLLGFLLNACQSDDDQITSVDPKNQTEVNFEFDASAIKYAIADGSNLKFSPTYSKNGFKIYAFKRAVAGTNYVFEKEVSLANMTYSAANKKLEGKDLLEIGTYKFLIAYGVEQTGVLTLPTWTGANINDNFVIEYDGTAPLNEIFVHNGDVNSLESYDLGLTSTANPTVKDTLVRAVSRVDVMFFKGSKSGGVYTELPYTSGDVFGGKTLDTLQLRYKGLNAKMDFFGNYVAATTLNKNIDITGMTKVTIGNAAATTVGNASYTKYDNVEQGDLITGAAHVFGNYVIPNANATATADLELYIKPTVGEARTITLANKLPMERNKVTLVKIYILDSGNGPDEPNVFTTNVNFEVEIETVWDGSHEVTGEIN